MMLRVLALALLASLAVPGASADLWDPEEAPCDGTPLVPGAEEENQARFAEFLCTYGPPLSAPACQAVRVTAQAMFGVVAVLAPGHAAPGAC